MKKQYVFLLSVILVALLFLSSCKNGGDGSEDLEEKRACFKECMLIEEDKAYCLDDCDMKEKDIEAKKDICGDTVCQASEEGGLCPEDCETCSTDADCAEKEVCEDSACKPVDCTEDSHCPDGYVCEDNTCTEEEEEIDTSATEEIQDTIDDLNTQIETLLNQIDALQTSLDAADASDEDIAAVQEDIDALDDVVTELESYKVTLAGYEDDLDAAETNAEVANVGLTIDTAKTEIEAYIEEQTTEVEAIEEAINDLEPEASADLTVDDLDFESIDGNDATFTITFTNDDEGNITANDSFRVKLTSYEEDNSTEVDDVKATFSDGLEPDEEGEVEVEIELEYNPEDYFNSNTTAQTYLVLFLVEVDVDDVINESDEDNNEEYFNITFDREDYVSNTAPVANITVSPSNASVSVNETVTFSGTGSTDSDGSISSYSWDFGDSYSSTSSGPTHEYTSTGSYTVTLTVTDNEGATDSETTTITVS